MRIFVISNCFYTYWGVDNLYLNTVTDVQVIFVFKLHFSTFSDVENIKNSIFATIVSQLMMFFVFIAI